MKPCFFIPLDFQKEQIIIKIFIFFNDNREYKDDFYSLFFSKNFLEILIYVSCTIYKRNI